MPIRTRLHRTLPPNAAELTRMLFNEWTQPSEAGQPVIVVEGQKPDPIHIYIIWDEWRGMNQTDRSEIIMDVYDNVMVGPRLQDHGTVTVAMGLTSEEAKRMGIEFE